MTAAPLPPPAPGNDHPAVAQYRRTVLAYDRDHVRVPVPSGPSWRCDVDGPTFPHVLEFDRHRAAQSLYPEYGTYVWPVWTDQHGRSIVGEAVWLDNPAAVALPEWNPEVRP
jgi:hypothetical protein